MAINKFVSTRNDKRSRLIPFSGGLDDGSTLNLDFTRMGTGADLSARGITFSRSSPATFINSSGYVDFPEINLFRNSSWSDSNPTPTSWTGAGNAPTIPSSGQRTFTVTTAATSYIAEAGTAATLANGLQYTASVDIVSVAGAVTFSNLITATASPTNTKWYLIVGGDPPVEYLGTDIISSEGRVVFTFTSGTSSFIRVGLGASGVNQTNQSVTLKNPMLTPGIKINTNYVPSASSTAPYYGPRFDYDPTTLAARGLLIEGSATNLLCYSESFATSGGSTNWGYNSNTGAVVSTPNPAGGSTAFQFAETANSGPLQQSVTVTNAVHTFSAWFKGSTYSGTTTTQVQFGLFVTAFVAGTATKISGPGSASVAGNIVTLSGLSTSEWTRVQFTTTSALSAGSVAILIYPNSTSLQTNASFYIWGAQLEAGSGPSSYIPTGASTVQRAADVCTMTGANFTSWYGAPTGWTLVTETIPQSRAAGTFPGMVALRSSGDSGLRIYYYNDGTYNTAFRFGTASSNSEVFGPNSVTYGLPRKFGASVTSGTQIASSAGVQIGATQTLAVPMDQTVLGIGNDGATTPAVHCRMHVRNIKYWPYAMTLAQLNGVTA